MRHGRMRKSRRCVANLKLGPLRLLACVLSRVQHAASEDGWTHWYSVAVDHTISKGAEMPLLQAEAGQGLDAAVKDARADLAARIQPKH
jgi:hypothetical protein